MVLSDIKERHNLAKKYLWEGHDLSLKDFNKREVAEAKNRLKDWLGSATKDSQGNPIVYCNVRSVSKSGMSRVISLFCVNENTGRIMHLSSSASYVLGWPMKNTSQGEGINVSGCGMDMGFHTVYTLSRLLYDDQEGDPGYNLTHMFV